MRAAPKNPTAEAESKKRKGVTSTQAPAKKKKKTGALVIAPAASSAASAGAASANTDGAQSSSAPSREMRAPSGGDSGSRGSPVRYLLGAAGSAEQPEASAANPMPDIFGGLYSSSEEGELDILRREAASPPPAAVDSQPLADEEWPETVPSVRSPVVEPVSCSPPPIARSHLGHSRVTGRRRRHKVPLKRVATCFF